MAIQNDTFCLKLNNFQLNISSTFRQLRGDTDFSDVTLISEDGQEVEAHRVVLSASSEVFSSMLKRNKHNHHMIYMRGLNAIDMHAVLDFIYHGETNVYQKDLSKFLRLAEELQLKGLSGVDSKEQLIENIIGDDHNKKLKILNENKQTIVKTSQEENDVWYIKKETVESLPINEQAPAGGNDGTTSVLSIKNNSELDKQISLMMNKIQGGWVCSVCGKQMIRNLACGTKRVNKGAMVQHIEANHIEASHPCEQCGKVSKSRHGLYWHKKKKHTI